MIRLLSRIPAWTYPLLVVCALAAWELNPDDDPLNPDALEALRSIVVLCTDAAQDGTGDAPCEDVRYVVEWCSTRGRGLCTASKVYDTMATLGFKLPPLHLQRP